MKASKRDFKFRGESEDSKTCICILDCPEPSVLSENEVFKKTSISGDCTHYPDYMIINQKI